MHLVIEELLAARDGEADPVAAAHLEGCDRCRAEVEALEDVRNELAALPEIGPRRDFWPEIERTAMPRAGGRGRWMAAVAAVVAVLATGALSYVTLNDRRGTEPAGAALDRSIVIDDLVSASRELEGLLSRPALQSRVMNPRQAGMIVVLEDRIADIDAVLTASSESVSEAEAMALWSHRVRLLAALVQVRGAPASNPVYQKAVHSEGRDS